MIYSVIVFLFFVVVFGLRNYLLKSKVPLIIKILHLIISFVLFQYYFGSFRFQLWDFIRNGFESFYTSEDFLYYSKSFDLMTSILFFLIAIYTAGLVLNMAVKAKSRRLLLYTSPIIAAVTSFDLFKLLVRDYEVSAELSSYTITLLFVSVIYGVINLFYNLNPGKQIFTLAQKVDYPP